MNVAMTTEYPLGGRWLAPLWRLLRRFVRDSNPTLGWRREPDLELVLNLDTTTLAGVLLGAHRESCARFGPCMRFTILQMEACCEEDGCFVDLESSDADTSYSFSYAREGFGFSAGADWHVESFSIDLFPEQGFRGAKAFSGTLIWDSGPLSLDAISTIERVVQTFGPPTFDSADHDIKYQGYCERILHYDWPHASWMLSIGEDGRTQSLHVSAPLRSGGGRIESPEVD